MQKLSLHYSLFTCFLHFYIIMIWIFLNPCISNSDVILVVSISFWSSCACAQFWGRLSLVCLHPGAHPILGSGAPSAPGPAAEPPTAPHSPASSGSQRPPCHFSEPGPAAHGPRRRGPPWGPTRGPGESGWSLSVQRDRGRPVEVKPWQLGSHGGADPPQRPGCQVLSVSVMSFFSFCKRGKVFITDTFSSRIIR